MASDQVKSKYLLGLLISRLCAGLCHEISSSFNFDFFVAALAQQPDCDFFEHSRQFDAGEPSHKRDKDVHRLCVSPIYQIQEEMQYVPETRPLRFSRSFDERSSLTAQCAPCTALSPHVFMRQARSPLFQGLTRNLQFKTLWTSLFDRSEATIKK